MRATSDDRWWAGALIVLGLTAGVVAVGFRVAFVTDPLGPRAFPWLGAGLLVVGGVGMWRRPGPDTRWPDGPARRRLGALAASLLVWSLALPWLGFVPATTLEIAFLARLFGARTRAGLAAGLGVSVLLWALFAWGLGLKLPTGGGS